MHSKSHIVFFFLGFSQGLPPNTRGNGIQVTLVSIIMDPNFEIQKLFQGA